MSLFLFVETNGNLCLVFFCFLSLSLPCVVETFHRIMSVSKAAILQLYRATRKDASHFKNYNFREYFLRNTRRKFEAAASLNQEQLAAFIKEAEKEALVIKRQAIVNSLYDEDNSIIHFVNKTK